MRRTKLLTQDDVTQRVICVDEVLDILPPPGTCFDLWFGALPWASKVRREPCSCKEQVGLHSHCYLEGGEVHAGLTWEVGAALHFESVEPGMIQLKGSVEA